MDIIVGSKAAHHWGLVAREGKDIDIWTQHGNHMWPVPVDATLMPEYILNMIPAGNEGYALPDALYTIKASHLGWDIFWEKHKTDLLLFKAQGCKLIPNLYSALVTHWKVVHGNKDFLSLYKDKTQFFTDSVNYVYDHDYLHELVAYPNAPVYSSCLKDGEDVAIDYAKFTSLPFEQQVKMFREEIVVIAIERWIVNPKTCGKVRWDQAYSYALRKTVTALTKNWATEFIVLNLEHFVNPSFKEFEHTLKTLPEGEIIMAKMVEETAAKAILNEMIERYNAIGDTKYPIEEGNIRELILEQVDVPDTEWLGQAVDGEGGAEYCYTVFKYKDVIYKITYMYRSYDGYDFDYSTLYEVTPKQKTITVYN